MIWILLAALGVPIWLVVGALGASIWSRKRFQKAPGVFKCSLLRISEDASGKEPSWPRVPAYARWVHDVLIVHAGLALVRNAALPVASAENVSKTDDLPVPKRLGHDPSIVKLRLDEGSVVALAVPREATDTQRGPFKPARVQPIEMRAG